MSLRHSDRRFSDYLLSFVSSSHSQTIIFDVNQPLEEVQASREAVKSTAIALVRVDSTFLPGTTIGATQWVAYAMTKGLFTCLDLWLEEILIILHSGRVRVISRSSGDRTLLQLPHVFPGTTAVTDMAVIGNRLAGITSDGGLVVWELPEVITDDVLYVTTSYQLSDVSLTFFQRQDLAVCVARYWTREPSFR